MALTVMMPELSGERSEPRHRPDTWAIIKAVAPVELQGVWIRIAAIKSAMWLTEEVLSQEREGSLGAGRHWQGWPLGLGCPLSPGV